MALQLQAVVAMNTAAFTGGLGGMTASLNKFAGMAMTMFGGVAAEISAMWASFGAAGAAMASLKQITAVGAGYEQRMAAVKSVTGLADDAIKKLADDGSAAAKKYGFTLQDTGAAMETLARTGIDSADKLNAILTPALLLAGSQNANLEDSTETLAAAMQAFQLDLSKSGEVADTFAGALAASPLNMERLKDAMKMAAPAAASLGMSVQQVTNEIAAFHVVGLHGSLAGTTFRGALLEVDKAARAATGPVGEALQGWTAESEGLTGAIKRLNDAGVSTGIVMEQFGNRAGPGMAQMMALGSDAMKEVAARVTRLSDVQKQYNSQMDTFNGRMKLLKANVEVVAMRLFTALAPALKFSAEAATLVVDALDKIGPVIAGLVSLIQNYGAVAASWFQTLGSAAQGMIGGLGILGVAVGVLGPIFVGLAKVIAVACLSMLKSLLAFVTPALVGIAAVVAAFAGFSLGQTISNIRVGTDTIEGHLTAFFTRVIIFAERDAALIAAQFQMMMLNIRKFILENAPGLIQAFGSFLAPIIEKFGEFRAWVLEKLNMDAAAAQVRAASKDMADSLRNINTDDALADIEQAAIRLRFKMDDISSDAAVRLEDALKQAGAAAKENLEGAIERAEWFDSWLEQMDENGVKVKDTLVSLGVDAKDAFNAMIAPVTDATDEIGALGDALGKIPKPAGEVADGVMDAAVAIDYIVGLIQDCNISFADAKALVQEFGEKTKEMSEIAKDTNRPISEIAKNFRWIEENGKLASEVIQNQFGNTVKNMPQFLKIFGEHAYAVAKKMYETGMSAESAARSLGILKTGMDDAPDPINKVTDSLAKAGKEALAFGKALLRMDQKTLDDIYQALKTFAEKLSKLPPVTLTWARDLGQLKLPPLGNVRFWKGNFLELTDALEQANTLDLDLSWADDLGKLNLPSLGGVGFWESNFEKLVEVLLPANALDLDFSWAEDLRELRLPRIGNVESFKMDFDKLLVALANVPAIDLTWMDSLTNFVLPETAFWMPLATTFSEFAEKLDKAAKPDLSWLKNLSIIDTVDVEKLRMIVDVLSGLAGKAYNASILIGWKDNETLASIDGHLATLAGMKGIIWG